MKKKLVISVAAVVLVVMLAMMCAACTPGMDSVEKKFKNKDYKTTVKTDDSLTMVKYSDALVPLPESSVTIIWYENEDKAKEAYELAIKLPGMSEKNAKRKGNAVASGDADAVKIF